MKKETLQRIIDFIRLKNNPVYDYCWNKRIKDNYLIVPIGEFCFPRVAATVCHLKKLRKYGEKTYPFDLAFFRDFDKIIELIDTKFENLYTNLEFEKVYKNNNYVAEFPHDGMLSKEDFKARYDKRIENFYQDIQTSPKKIIFTFATKKNITKNQVERLVEVLKKYRPDNFRLIIFYCNIKDNLNINDKNIFVIDNIDLASINSDSGWSNRIKSITNKSARRIINRCKKAFKKAIKS